MKADSEVLRNRCWDVERSRRGGSPILPRRGNLRCGGSYFHAVKLQLSVGFAVRCPWRESGHRLASRTGGVASPAGISGRDLIGRFVSPTDQMRSPNVGKLALALTCLAQSGCSAAPDQNILGSFFPSWLLCIGLGFVAAALGRLLLGTTGINEHLFSPLLTYCALAVACALLIWLLFFGH